MQREGLIGFALLLTLAVLSPQGGVETTATADSQSVPVIDVSQAGGSERPAMTLTSPAAEDPDCTLHEHGKVEQASGVHLQYNVNVSI